MEFGIRRRRLSAPRADGICPPVTFQAIWPSEFAAGAGIGGRKWETIRFADVERSLEMIEGTDPEQAQAILDGAVGAMMDAVHRFDDSVNKVPGDGFLAIFGAPLALKDHAVRRCFAALTLRQAMAEVSAESANPGSPGISRARPGWPAGR